MGNPFSFGRKHYYKTGPRKEKKYNVLKALLKRGHFKNIYANMQRPGTMDFISLRPPFKPLETLLKYRIHNYAGPLGNTAPLQIQFWPIDLSKKMEYNERQRRRLLQSARFSAFDL